MASNPNHINIDYEGEPVSVPVETSVGETAMAAMAVSVELVGNQQEGGGLVDSETGEPLVVLLGEEDAAELHDLAA